METLNYTVLGKEQKFDNYVEINNASTNEPFAKVPALGQADIDAVAKYAKETQKEWALLTIAERAKFLLAWADKLEEHKEDLANTLVIEIAKPYNDAITEVVRTADIIRYTVEEMYRLDLNAASSEQYYGGNRSKVAITRREPVGVVLAIAPFNYPINLAVAKIAPALISGNTVLFKPATQGSVVGVKIANLLAETGIMDGVLNVTTGRGREIGDYLVEREEVNFISFTGGTSTGKNIAKLAGMIPQVMELGGKDAAIVLDDADLDHTAKEIIGGAFNYSGQRCTAIKRVLVSEKNAATLTEKLVSLAKDLTVGKPEDNAVIVPLISAGSADYVEGLINDAKEQGSTIEMGDKREGNLIYPTIISNVKRTDRVAIEEPFGPVLPIIVYKDLAEAIEIHNENEYGLQASIFGSNMEDMFNLAPKLEAGTVNLNGKTSRGPDNFPFTGHKNSGLGVQGIKEALMSMTKPRTLVINIK